jgi:adenosylcobinamide amidohydrolase
VRDIAGDSLYEKPGWLCLRLGCAHRSLGWAPVGGVSPRVRAVLWHRPPEGGAAGRDPEWLAALARSLGIEDALALVTRTPLEDLVVDERHHRGDWVRCLALVRPTQAVRSDGLARPLPPAKGLETGGLQLVVQVSSALTAEASAEALALASEARTIAVLDARLRERGGARASGASGGTSVILSPLDGNPRRACGLRSSLGHALAEAVHAAVAAGIERWLQRLDGVVKGLVAPGAVGESELLEGWFDGPRRIAR